MLYFIVLYCNGMIVFVMSNANYINLIQLSDFRAQ